MTDPWQVLREIATAKEGRGGSRKRDHVLMAVQEMAKVAVDRHENPCPYPEICGEPLVLGACARPKGHNGAHMLDWQIAQEAADDDAGLEPQPAGEWGRELRNRFAAVLLALEVHAPEGAIPAVIESGKTALVELEARMHRAVIAEAGACPECGLSDWQWRARALEAERWLTVALELGESGLRDARDGLDFGLGCARRVEDDEHQIPVGPRSRQMDAYLKRARIAHDGLLALGEHAGVQS